MPSNLGSVSLYITVNIKVVSPDFSVIEHYGNMKVIKPDFSVFEHYSNAEKRVCVCVCVCVWWSEMYNTGMKCLGKYLFLRLNSPCRCACEQQVAHKKETTSLTDVFWCGLTGSFIATEGQW